MDRPRLLVLALFLAAAWLLQLSASNRAAAQSAVAEWPKVIQRAEFALASDPADPAARALATPPANLASSIATWPSVAQNYVRGR